MRVYTNADESIAAIISNGRNVCFGRNWTVERVAKAIEDGVWRGPVRAKYAHKVAQLTTKMVYVRRFFGHEQGGAS